MRRISRSGFTLIELLTVMAISVVLLTIIVVPVFQTFNFTRSAQAFSEAQDRARLVADRISREIGNAAAVRNTQGVVATTLNGNNASVLANSVIVQVPKLGETPKSPLTWGNIAI
jgi:prepilin-type N-terminal cleavage/methylation domain-containing protein